MPRSRIAGFTLIELLVVIVIIGILAAVAIPSYRATRQRAYVGAMKSDLHNVTSAEEAYYYQYDVYTNDVSQLKFKPTVGVTVTISNASASGWGAAATNPAADPVTCAVYFGATAVAPATAEGVITCR